MTTERNGTSKEEYQLLEEEFSAYIGTPFATAVNSGTSALTLALAALNIGPGDEVIVPDFTMIATAWAVTYRGATPVFVDCDYFGNIDPVQIALKISPKTKAIIVTHVFGRMVDMEAVLEIARNTGIFVIEDACEAHGATQGGKKAGSFGDIGCFSFYKNKIVHGEEGGMCVTSSSTLKDRMDYMKNMAFSQDHDYTHETLGYNFRMPNSQAVMIRESLAQIDSEIARRRKFMANVYEDLKGRGMGVYFSEEDVPWVVPFMTASSEHRDAAREYCAIKGYETRPFFKPASSQAPYFMGQGKPLARHLSGIGFYVVIK